SRSCSSTTPARSRPGSPRCRCSRSPSRSRSTTTSPTSSRVCGQPGSGPSSTTVTTGSARRSATPARRRSPSSSSRAGRTSRPEPCPSGSGTGVRTTVCRWTRRSSGSWPRCGTGHRSEMSEEDQVPGALQEPGEAREGREPEGAAPPVAEVVVPALGLPGAPDGFDRLWTPHRMVYLNRGAADAGADASTGRGAAGADGPAPAADVPQAGGRAPQPEGDGDEARRSCPFCRAPDQADDEGLVVARGELAFVVLNLYPYNPGHLMVCPYRHVPDYTDLTSAETLEVAERTRTAMRVLRGSGSPAGFNLGMNQGEVGGAGIVGHLHQHVVPRWAGDSNFLPIIAR